MRYIFVILITLIFYGCSTEPKIVQKKTNIISGKESEIDLPKSNVLQFFTEDGSKISIRPSGTEPKIKYYFGVTGKLLQKNDFGKVNQLAEEKIKQIIADLNLSQ